VAVALLKPTVPKFASGSGWQLPELSHWDGASAIHSALETSGLLIGNVFVADAPVVVSDNDTVTFVPLTVTLPDMWSPDEIVRSSRTGAEGTSSYHAKWLAVAPLLQSTSVPTCSSAWDCCPAPPSPSQKEESPCAELQSADGSIQLPETLENCCAAPVADPAATYPDQLALTAVWPIDAAEAEAAAAPVIEPTAASVRIKRRILIYVTC
jgi:hypothetical protein